jgi:protein disulfide-isomerase A6
MQRKTAVVLAVLFACSALAAAADGLYPSNSNVIALNKKNFNGLVMESDFPWVVEFYAPWCGHCKNLAPEYEIAATNLKGLVKVGGVNCDDESAKELCGVYEIKGFPTIKVFPAERTTKRPAKTPSEYQGGRTAAAIVQFATGKIGNFVKTVTTSNADEFLKNPLNKVILFSDKPQTTSLYKAVATEYKGRLAVGEVKKSESSLVEKFGIKSFPTLIVLKGEEQITYDGKLKIDAINEFLSKFAPPPPRDPNSPPPPPPEEKPVLHVVHTQEQLEAACLSKTLTCVFVVLDEDNAAEGVNEVNRKVLQEVVDKFYKRFVFVALDAVKSPQIPKFFNMYSGYPSLAVVAHRKKAWVQYVGAYEPASIGEFLDRVLLGQKRLIPLPGTLPILSSGK